MTGDVGTRAGMLALGEKSTEGDVVPRLRGRNTRVPECFCLPFMWAHMQDLYKEGDHKWVGCFQGILQLLCYDLI